MKKATKSIAALALVLGLVSIFTNARAQTEEFKDIYSVGVGFMPDWQVGGDFGGKFSPSYGIEFDAQFSRHSGAILGIYNRPLQYETRYREIPYAGSASATYRETSSRDLYHYISLRMGYKFFSDIVNFSTSVCLDISANDKLNHTYGLMVSVSKDIKIYKGLVFEPEIHVNPFLSHKSSHEDPSFVSKSENREAPMVYGGMFLGVGVKLKYRF